VAVADCVVVVAALTTMWATSPRIWSMTAMAGDLLQNEERWQAAAMDSRPLVCYLHVPRHRQHGSCDGGRALYFQSVAEARSRRSTEGVHHTRLRLERSFSLLESFVPLPDCLFLFWVLYSKYPLCRLQAEKIQRIVRRKRERNMHSILPANRQLQTLKGTGVSRADCAAYDTRGREEVGRMNC
jgi:hypothetical protein